MGSRRIRQRRKTRQQLDGTDESLLGHAALASRARGFTAHEILGAGRVASRQAVEDLIERVLTIFVTVLTACDPPFGLAQNVLMDQDDIGFFDGNIEIQECGILRVGWTRQPRALIR